MNRRGDRITFKGTQDMLFDWRQKISPSDQHQKLKEALIKANLVELSDNFLKEVPKPEGNPNADRQEIRAPNRRITDKTIEADVVELRDYEFRLPTESLDGKVVGYLAFLPLSMPNSRKPVLNLVIYDNLPGFKKSLCEEMDAKGRISRDIERLFFIESSNHNSLEVSCSMDETDDDLRETLYFWDLHDFGRNVLDFTLDCNHLSTNDSNVKVTLTHGKRRRNSIFVVDMKGNATKTAWGDD
ncbi:uncharacterized protein LOC105442429 [Strongylocentrotus purpuratus]|uniref:Uncharacterized protein n=1 Tax=Strongylocentrotus purpuratus TaxID=7668 RepID=A0A7M7PFX6_STRPU|nr:uncharacterized protein LOC105442429 [Strongylocentrotus purpuratus]